MNYNLIYEHVRMKSVQGGKCKCIRSGLLFAYREQVLEILSSHLITNMDNETVYQNLKDLRHSDTRVILLHMQG